MCIHEAGLWSLWAQFEKGTQPSKCFSTLEKLLAQPGERHTQSKKSQTYLPCEAQGSKMHRGDRPKAIGPGEEKPHTLVPLSRRDKCKLDVVSKEMHRPAITSSVKEIPNLTWPFPEEHCIFLASCSPRLYSGLSLSTSSPQPPSPSAVDCQSTASFISPLPITEVLLVSLSLFVCVCMYIYIHTHSAHTHTYLLF